ncbi:MAG: hypothetical protein J3Q66DRAFT_325352 [Benniella sp.]|nr:MAG: hypothetical protein J3Q66DRAFT_325352 [Benniella sp.]
MMMIFFFFTVILLLNVLIALVNDAFSESVERSGSTYWKLVADVIAEVETQTIFSPLLSGYNRPGLEYTYYCASDEEIKRFRSESEFSVFAYETNAVQRMLIKEVRDTNNSTKEELRRELTEMKMMVGRTTNDELRIELTELRGLVRDLFQLKSN